MQEITGYEVRIGGTGLGEVGTIIPYAEISPRTAQVLIDHRRLRPLALRGYGTLAEEREHWRKELKPYEIAGPDKAVKGSALARLVSEAAATEKAANAAEKQAETLATQLSKAQGVVTAADEKADFAVIARAQAEIAVVGRLAHDAEREATASRKTADEAARAVTKAWQRVESARVAILKSIAGDLLDKSGSIWWGAWKLLRNALDVQSEKQAARWPEWT